MRGCCLGAGEGAWDVAQHMLEAALRAATLRDAKGRSLHTLADLLTTVPELADDTVPVPRGAPTGPAEPAEADETVAPVERDQPVEPVLLASMPLADAVGRLLSGPHSGGDRVVVVDEAGGRHRYSAWELFTRLTGALAHSTLFDPLTGLPARRWVLDEVTRRLATASGARPLGVLQIELGQLKDINDSLGYDIGDGLIVDAARRIRAALGPADSVGRLVGDEFAVILGALAGAEAPDAAMAVARRLLEVLAAGVSFGEHEIPLQASVGVCVVVEPVETAEHVLRRADSAMYRAKSSGRGRAELYDPATDLPVDKLSMGRRLRVAMATGGLHLNWQPIYRLADGALVGAEALVRWQDESGAFVPPEEFIPYAETAGLIVPIGALVLNAAVGQASLWRAMGVRLPVSVNLSPQQVVASDLVTEVRSALERHGVPPADLRLELTETAAVTDYGVTQSRLAELRELGVSLSLDDFGTGYSSLRLLRDLAVDDVKVDRSFVSGVDLNAADAAMVRLVVETSHALGLTVTAEGVERPGQLAALAALGCDQVQGYLLGVPVPVDRFELTGSAAAAAAFARPDDGRALGA